MDTTTFFTHVQATFTECFDLMIDKNHDYANTNPFSNFENATEIGIRPEQAIMYMVKLKINRLANLIAKNDGVKNESMRDSVVDCINYLAILEAYLSKQPCTSDADNYIPPPGTPR